MMAVCAISLEQTYPLDPSGYVKIAIENGPVEIVDLPIEHGDFQ